jgi:hypothetical protein
MTDKLKLGERDKLIGLYNREYNKLKNKEFEQLSHLEKNSKTNPYLEEVAKDTQKCMENKCRKHKETIANMKMLIDYINTVCESGLVTAEDRITSLKQEKNRIKKEIKKIEKEIRELTERKEQR